MSVPLNAAVAWTARDAVLAQLERYRPLARADARYRVTVARLEMSLAALDAAPAAPRRITMSRPTTIALLASLLAALVLALPALADSSTCHRDSGGHLICRSLDSNGQRCSATCRVDSGGRQVCKTTCR